MLMRCRTKCGHPKGRHDKMQTWTKRGQPIGRQQKGRKTIRPTNHNATNLKADEQKNPCIAKYGLPHSSSVDDHQRTKYK